MLMGEGPERKPEDPTHRSTDNGGDGSTNLLSTPSNNQPILHANKKCTATKPVEEIVSFRFENERRAYERGVLHVPE